MLEIVGYLSKTDNLTHNLTQNRKKAVGITEKRGRESI